MNSTIHRDLLERVRAYKIPPAAAELLKVHPPLIIAGVTASGKDSVAKRLIETSNYREVVTHTTRMPRPGEVHAQHYHFVNEAEMLELAASGQMVELQDIHGGNVYGTSIAAYKTVLGAGYKPLLIIDIQGTEEIIRQVPTLSVYFLIPPSFNDWITRLDGRGHMTHTEKSRRFRSAKSELEKALTNRKFIILVNREVNDTARQITHIGADDPAKRRAHEIARQLIEELGSY